MTIQPPEELLSAKNGSNRLELLEREVYSLREQLRDGQSFIVPVETLAPEPFDVKRPFHIVVRPSEGEFIATLFDANLGMSGDTEEESVANLKATLVDTFDLFEANESALGPEPKRQLAVLRELIQRRL